jgi:hypothetical protein
MKPNGTTIDTWFVLGFAALSPTYSTLRRNRRPAMLVSLLRAWGKVGEEVGPAL